MDIRFSIRVVDEDGEPVKGARVTGHYLLTQSEEYTDEDGWVELEKNIMAGNGV